MLNRLINQLERAWDNYYEYSKICEKNPTPKQYGEMLATKKRCKKKAR